MKLNNSLMSGIFLVFLPVFFVKSQSPILDKIPQDDINISVEEITIIVESLKLNGWELHDEVEKFKPINLYDKINGRAEYYISYDMIWTIFGNFSRNMDTRFSIELSIFNMGTPTNAFGVFSGERTWGAPSLKIGRDAYYSRGGYYIWKGQYYIQIVASETTDGLQKACLDLAEKLTDKLNDSGKPVWGFEALPANNQVPHSVQYFLNDAMGHNFLKNTYTAKYYRDNIEIPVFLSRQDSPTLVEAIISKFEDHVHKYGKEVGLISVDGIEMLVCDFGNYYDVIFQKGSLVFGVTGVKDKNLAIKASLNFWKQLQIE